MCGTSVKMVSQRYGYPTPADVTRALLIFLALQPCTIWEPACGDGAMSRVLESVGHTVISTDIRHTGYGEGGVDFLTCNSRQCDAVITNPPFNESVGFIRKALDSAPIVAMMLKSQYWHTQERYALFKERRPALVLPLLWRPNFLEGVPGKKSPTMECLWTVWLPDSDATRYEPLPRPRKQAELFLEAKGLAITAA